MLWNVFFFRSDLRTSVTDARCMPDTGGQLTMLDPKKLSSSGKEERTWLNLSDKRARSIQTLESFALRDDHCL
jgi:hypothetical protein